jgi:hypothetical protein
MKLRNKAKAKNVRTSLSWLVMSEVNGSENPQESHQILKDLDELLDGALKREGEAQERANGAVGAITNRLADVSSQMGRYTYLGISESEAVERRYHAGLFNHTVNPYQGTVVDTYRLVVSASEGHDVQPIARLKHETTDGTTTGLTVHLKSSELVSLRSWHFLDEYQLDVGRIAEDLGRDVDDPQIIHLSTALDLLMDKLPEHPLEQD